MGKEKKEMSKEEKEMWESIVPKPERVLLPFSKGDLINHKSLSERVPWVNHGNKIGLVLFNEPIDIFYVKTNVPYGEPLELKEIKCNEVEITAMHGGAGTHYNFVFYMNDVQVDYVYGYSLIGFSKEEAKDKFVKQSECQIEGLTNKINNIKDDIELIKKL